MNIVDSSGWLEYFAASSNGKKFGTIIKKTSDLVVPSISLYEVFKKILQQCSEKEAMRTIAFMQKGKLVSLDEHIALSSAKVSYRLKLPMADSIMLATAYRFKATLWTQDADFKGLPGVEYIKKGRSSLK